MQYCVVTAYVFCFVYYTLGYDRKHREILIGASLKKLFPQKFWEVIIYKKLLCGNKENTYLLGRYSIGIHLFLIYYLWSEMHLGR